MRQETILLLATHATKGGIINYMGLLKRRFEADGHRVMLVSLYRGDNDDDLADMRILVDKPSMSPIGYVVAFVRFILLCVKTRPTVTLGTMMLANIFIGIWGLISRCKTIATHHCPYDMQSRLLQKIDFFLGRLGAYWKIVCVSHAVAESFGSPPPNFQSRIAVITNGIPILAQQATRIQVRQKYGLLDNEAFLVITGRLSPQKNVIAAVNAMAATSNIRLFLTGEGSLRSELEEIIATRNLASKVHLLGTIPKQDVVDLVYACDAFVQVSLYEGHSMSLLEAIYARCHILVSQVPTQVEAVTLPDGRVAAVICDPESIEDISQGLKEVAFNQVRRGEIFEAVKVLADTLPTEEIMLDQYSILVRSGNDLLSPIPAH